MLYSQLTYVLIFKKLNIRNRNKLMIIIRRKIDRVTQK